MIVCSCKVVSDHRIRDAVERGLTWKQLVKETKLATECGACGLVAKSIYDQAKASKASAVPKLDSKS